MSAVCSMNFVFNTLHTPDQNRVRMSGHSGESAGDQFLRALLRKGFNRPSARTKRFPVFSGFCPSAAGCSGSGSPESGRFPSSIFGGTGSGAGASSMVAGRPEAWASGGSNRSRRRTGGRSRGGGGFRVGAGVICVSTATTGSDGAGGGGTASCTITVGGGGTGCFMSIRANPANPATTMTTDAAAAK